MKFLSEPMQRRALPWEMPDPSVPGAGGVPVGPPTTPLLPDDAPVPPMNLFGGQVVQ